VLCLSPILSDRCWLWVLWISYAFVLLLFVLSVACKSWVVSCWHGYLQSADDYTWSSWCFVKIQNGLPIWWQLTKLSWKKRLLTDCCCCYCCCYCYCCYLPAGAVAKYCDEHVCLSVCLSICLSVCEAISRTTHAIFTNFSVHVA